VVNDYDYLPERIAERRGREAAPEPAEAIGTTRVSVGTVKYWRSAKGYGAISGAEVAPFDIWCGFWHIDEPSGSRNLTPGDTVRVEFMRINRESFKYVACRVRRAASEEPNAK